MGAFQRILQLAYGGLGKEMATHSSTLAWKIPWTEKAGRLQSMGLQRVGHDCASFTSHSGLDWGSGRWTGPQDPNRPQNPELRVLGEGLRLDLDR